MEDFFKMKNRIDPNSIRRPIDPVDKWLKKEGFQRKNLTYNPTCLFRAVSENIYLTQFYYKRVRNETIQFIKDNKDNFIDNLPAPIDNYLDDLINEKKWANVDVINAMSILYKREFIVLNYFTMAIEKVTDNNFDQVIYLCESKKNFYEPVFERGSYLNAAYCQSLTYKAFYEMFNVGNLENTVRSMLCSNTNTASTKSNTTSSHRSKYSLQNIRLKTSSRQHHTREIIPFPFRVAKALHPHIYRNIDLDVQRDLKIEVNQTLYLTNNNYYKDFKIGSKCFVELKDRSVYIGHIQDMSPNYGPVVVFLEGIGEKRIVPYSALHRYSRKKDEQFLLNIPNEEQQQIAVIQDVQTSQVSFNKTEKHSFDGQINFNNNNCNISGWTIDSNVQHNAQLILQNFSGILNNYSNRRYTLETVYENPFEEDSISEIIMENNNNQLKLNNNNLATTQELKENSAQNTDFDDENSTVVNGNNELVEKPIEESIKNQNSNEGQFEQLEQQQPPPSQRWSPSTVMLPNNDNNSNVNNYYYPPASESPVYPGNVNVIYLSPEGNNYQVQMPYYSNNYGSGYANQYDQGFNPAASLSFDINGNDLPFADIPTLRYFFNLGVQYFRINHQGCVMGPQMVYSPGPECYSQDNFLPPTNMTSSIESKVTDDNIPMRQNNFQPRQNFDNRRKNNGSANNRSKMNSYNSRANYYKREFHDVDKKTKQDSINNQNHDNYKSKSNKSSTSNGGTTTATNNNNSNYNNNSSNSINHKECNNNINNETVDNRKNAGTGRFKKNEVRNRMDKSGNIHQDMRASNNNNYGYYEDFNSVKYDYPQQLKTPSKMNGNSTCGYQTIQAISQPVYSNVLSNSKDMENYYLPGDPVYTVPYVVNTSSSIKDTNNSGNYACSNIDKYPVYSPIPYLPPPLYSPGPNHQKKWYSSINVPQYVNYPTQAHNPNQSSNKANISSA